jgi:hypothetical protein
MASFRRGSYSGPVPNTELPPCLCTAAQVASHAQKYFLQLSGGGPAAAGEGGFGAGYFPAGDSIRRIPDEAPEATAAADMGDISRAPSAPTGLIARAETTSRAHSTGCMTNTKTSACAAPSPFGSKWGAGTGGVTSSRVSGDGFVVGTVAAESHGSVAGSAHPCHENVAPGSTCGSELTACAWLATVFVCLEWHVADACMVRAKSFLVVCLLA